MIIGIAGTLGSGKGTVVAYLAEHYGYTHYSVRKFLIEELNRRGIEVVRPEMSKLANEMRAEHGSGYIAEQLLQRALKSGDNAVIESIHSTGEAEYLQTHGAKLWGVNADVSIRYQRILERASETDRVTFDQFKADEEREYANADPTKHNILAVITRADVVFENNGVLEELYEQIERALVAEK